MFYFQFFQFFQCSSSSTVEYEVFHDGSIYHIGTNPLMSSTNQWTGLSMIGTSVMKKLNTAQIKGDIRTL